MPSEMQRAIEQKLMSAGLVSKGWADAVELNAQLVTLYRQYYDGEHRSGLDDNMKRMLRINDERLERFNANYCKLIVDKMVSRLTVRQIEAVPATAPTDPAAAQPANQAQVWWNQVAAFNRFDALQKDIIRATVRDGETLVMAWWDETKGRTLFTHELAYDGDWGCIAVYDRMKRAVVAVVKVWWEGETYRVNFYFADRVEKYQWVSGMTDEDTASKTAGDLRPLADEGADENGAMSYANNFRGIPFVHFRNESQSYRTTGNSELANAIPMQDVINRAWYSTVMTAELTAFAIMLIKGIDYDKSKGITPGMILKATVKEAALQSAADAGAVAPYLAAMGIERIAPGGVTEYITELNQATDTLSEITRTPLARMMGGNNESGEALQTRQEGLLEKVSEFQVKGGNAFEDLAKLAHGVETAHGPKKPPAVIDWHTAWMAAAVRNDQQKREDAKWYHDSGYEREALRVMGHDDTAIDKLMAEKSRDTESQLSSAMGRLPNFSSNGNEFGAEFEAEAVAAN